MAKLRAIIRTLEIKWIKCGKTKDQRRRLRYYYRHKVEILDSNKSPYEEKVDINLL